MTQNEMNSLTNNLITDTSRYNDDKVITEYNNNYVFNNIKSKQYPFSDKDKYFVVTNNLIRIEELAQKYYGNPKLWYIIAQANNITNPLLLEIGQTIRIPTIN